MQCLTATAHLDLPNLSNATSIAQSIVSPALIEPPSLALSMATIETPAVKMANMLSNFHIDPEWVSIATSINKTITTALGNAFKNIVENMSSALMAFIKSPIVEWLQSFDFTPILTALEELKIDEEHLKRLDELNEKYINAMYECKWFPYAGWTAGIDLLVEVSDILATSRGKSKRREKRIDKAILDYYTPNEIKIIKRSWNNSNLEPYIKKALGQTLEAFLRKEYALVIPFLATMWEGLIKSKLSEKKRSNNELKKDFSELVDENGFEKVFSDFYNEMIIKTCYSVEDVVEGVPNRHSIAHSWYIKYPTRKAALNAILLTDFLIKLKPKENAEDPQNEQTQNAHPE
ncbi:MAG: hypothetical protein IKK91_05855 [Ruminococcus sp.]|nr:hypothetical protein [Ruminococcus sp.]